MCVRLREGGGVCLCVCERERERDKLHVCVSVSLYLSLSLSLSLSFSFPIIRLFSSLQLHSRATMMWMSKTQFEESDVDAAAYAAAVSCLGIWVIFCVRTLLSRKGTKE